MKKLSFTARERDRRLRKKRWMRELCSRKKQKYKKRFGYFPSENTDSGSSHTALRNHARFPVPENFSLETNPDEVLKFLDTVRTKLPNVRNFNIDFSKLRHVGPCAALLFVAEMYRLRHAHGIRPRVRPKNFRPEVLQQLDEMGLFEILDMINPKHKEAEQGSVSFIKFRTDTQALGKDVAELMDDIEKLTGGLRQRAKLYEAITEAMTNVAHHAYPDWAEHKDYERSPMPGRWWLAGQHDHDAQKLTVMFLDQGVGIPKTLPRNAGVEWLNNVLIRLGVTDSDESRIEAATKHGTSKTHLSNRGHGIFRNIRAYVGAVSNGKLRIVSNGGEYRYIKETGKEAYEEKISLSHSIGGTLILWEWGLLA